MELIDTEKLAAHMAPLFDNLTVRLVQAVKDAGADLGKKKLVISPIEIKLVDQNETPP